MISVYILNHNSFSFSSGNSAKHLDWDLFEARIRKWQPDVHIGLWFLYKALIDGGKTDIPYFLCHLMRAAPFWTQQLSGT
jgi:hypothetical protein